MHTVVVHDDPEDLMRTNLRQQDEGRLGSPGEAVAHDCSERGPG
jgi:hypothetical protein